MTVKPNHMYAVLKKNQK